MKRNGKSILFRGSLLLVAFVVWTVLIQRIDVQAIGLKGTNIGFATLNTWFHNLTGIHMKMYILTDWLGLVPIFVCMIFSGVGFVQLMKRRSLFKVDYDILYLGIYYSIVIFSYLFFEMVPINYRPVLIDGFMEASYPSSTTLLVLSVMPTLVEQTGRRVKSGDARKCINVFAISFCVFMVLGRIVSGVHWITDIVGSILLSAGLFGIYKALVLLGSKEEY